MIPTICKELSLVGNYTNSSVKMTALTILSQNSFPIQNTKKLPAHKWDSAIEYYGNRLSEQNSMHIHDQLTAALGGDPSTRKIHYGERDTSDKEKETDWNS